MRKALLAALAVLLSSPALADTLIDNARGIQVGPDGQLQRFRALVVNDKGKVVQVLRDEQDAVMPIARRVDVGGRTLLPGLIDAHGHVVDSPGGDMGLGLMILQLDLNGTSSIADLQKRLAAYAKANPGTGWIVGRGWNQELWPDKRFPTAADLDAVVPGRPVMLARVDGHAVIANSAALKTAGVTSAARDPQGGKIERGAKSEPTGLLVDNAIALVASHVPQPTTEMMDRGLEAAQEFLLSNGITAVADMGTARSSWDAMQRLGAAGKLRMRIIAYADGSQPLANERPTEWQYDDRLRMVGFKLYADGALGSRGAWLKLPYADKPDTSGLQFLKNAELLAKADEAASRGFQIAVHAIGDAANAQVISAYEQLSRNYGKDRRWRIEHFQIADPADIPRLAPAGIIASMQPTHQTSDRLMAEKRLGPDRLRGAYAWQSVIKSGARIAFGSDFPVESPNPFPGLSAAVSRQDINGQPQGGWIPEERVSFEQALSGFTRDAAYAGFAEQKIGALEPGKWADFIIVDRDISASDPQDLARTQVLETWVAGKKVWSRASGEAGERGK
ncbi:amidohydrolase family protein [Sphingomonas sediminicola]|uniref:Amidohydrolase family protein n=1 Tax=Sphingomonas sediminicola TaxID=386874 RepID=A0ABX6T578_9SPHN|nr:amidohydrolase [Sphingomonas sediminicola]QNP45036.1 amidohydrolase family protein [Sphingomonas sediminicola]